MKFGPFLICASNTPPTLLLFKEIIQIREKCTIKLEWNLMFWCFLTNDEALYIRTGTPSNLLCSSIWKAHIHTTILPTYMLFTWSRPQIKWVNLQQIYTWANIKSQIPLSTIDDVFKQSISFDMLIKSK